MEYGEAFTPIALEINMADHSRPFYTDGINPGTVRGACSCGWVSQVTRVGRLAAKKDIGAHLVASIPIEGRRGQK